jgi:UDP-4-amino-4,6-dideoxy-N-acetyl-beta-L-altrosamine N-acetyltransferase
MAVEDTSLRPMNEEDLEVVLAWRNHPDIRRYMFTRHEITLDEHRRWFRRSSRDAARRLLIFASNGEARGFVHFNGVAAGGIADWGFYAAPDAPKATGRALGRAALRYGFQVEGLHKVCGQALEFNLPAIRFHRALGFQQEGVLRDQHRDGASYHAVVCFGLLQVEWNPAAPE